jgi:hypothetical protein
LKEAADWVERYRRFWEERFNRLDDYLRELQAQQARRRYERRKERRHDRKRSR